jgi:RNA polymerase sigma-70 factor (ECF subfamily)
MDIDFSSLYERYAQDVYRFALYLCGDVVLAQEITADTFARAWTAPAKIRLATAKAYLFVIARNLCSDNRNRQARQVELDENLPDLKAGPDVIAGTRLDLLTVLKALEAIPTIDRAALLMHVQDGMPYAEIAEALAISLPAVKVKIHRSRLKLNQLLKDKFTYENHP